MSSAIKSGDLVGHATCPPLSTVRLSQVILGVMQQVGLDLKRDKSGDFVGHAIGPPLFTVGLSQVTLWAMQQVRLYLQWC